MLGLLAAPHLHRSVAAYVGTWRACIIIVGVSGSICITWVLHGPRNEWREPRYVMLTQFKTWRMQAGAKVAEWVAMLHVHTVRPVGSSREHVILDEIGSFWPRSAQGRRRG